MGSAARSLSRRAVLATSSAAAGRVTNVTKHSLGARRRMGGGAHWMEVCETRTMVGEVAGFLTWIWIFYRAKEDLGVVLGWRHPWEHAPDPWAIHDDLNEKELETLWEADLQKLGNPGEDDDDDDDDEDDDIEDDEIEDEEEEEEEDGTGGEQGGDNEEEEDDDDE